MVEHFLVRDRKALQELLRDAIKHFYDSDLARFDLVTASFRSRIGMKSRLHRTIIRTHLEPTVSSKNRQAIYHMPRRRD
ncbi:MAG: hypothetical protein WCL10_19595 [Novosphingobium sp.]